MPTAARGFTRDRATALLRYWVRGGPALWIGSVLFLCLLLARLWVALTASSDANRLDFKFAPSHVPLLRGVLEPSPLAGRDLASLDSLCSPAPDLLLGERCVALGDTRVLRQPMPPVARAGRPFRFTPQLQRPVEHWSLVNAPEGLHIDSSTGVISGTPITVKRHDDVVLVAQLDSVTTLRQHVRFFVDDRYLLLGADGVGDDIFENLLRATEFLLAPAFITVLVGVGGATVAGAYAGYYGGRWRLALLSVTSSLQSIPGLLLIFVVAVTTNSNRWVAMVVVGLVLAPETALGILERVEQFRRRDFVSAARELGMRDRTILWNEIIWHNARDFVANRLANGFLFAALMEITLSYAGLLDANSASLGNMMKNGRRTLSGQSEPIGEAAAAMAGLVLVVATFSLLERGVRRSWARRR